MAKTYYLPGTVFTGEQFVTDHAVEVTGGRITNIIPKDQLPQGSGIHALPEMTLAPSFVELQIYGGDGKMFSLYPSVESLSATYEYCIRGGTAHFMATVATNNNKTMFDAIRAVQDYWEKGLPGLLGLQLEGPFLNPAKKGAHLTQFIRKPSLDEVKELVEKGKGAFKMMTLAPECCSNEVISYLLDHGILVSAGHSNATYEEAEEGFNLGIPAATHLYNAMSPLLHRAPGMVGAVFNSHAHASIVADGIHVNFAAIRIAKKIMGERLFLITDAVTEARSDSYTYIFDKDHYITENGTLAGSCLTLGKAVRNLINQVGIEPGEALRMASLYPAGVAGLDDHLGKIKPGYQADMVILDGQFGVKGNIIAGKLK